jgi:hypothetical protein
MTSVSGISAPHLGHLMELGIVGLRGNELRGDRNVLLPPVNSRAKRTPSSENEGRTGAAPSAEA